MSIQNDSISMISDIPTEYKQKIQPLTFFSIKLKGRKKYNFLDRGRFEYFNDEILFKEWNEHRDKRSLPLYNINNNFDRTRVPLFLDFDYIWDELVPMDLRHRQQNCLKEEKYKIWIEQYKQLHREELYERMVMFIEHGLDRKYFKAFRSPSGKVKVLFWVDTNDHNITIGDYIKANNDFVTKIKRHIRLTQLSGHYVNYTDPREFQGMFMCFFTPEMWNKYDSSDLKAISLSDLDLNIPDPKVHDIHWINDMPVNIPMDTKNELLNQLADRSFDYNLDQDSLNRFITRSIKLDSCLDGSIRSDTYQDDPDLTSDKSIISITCQNDQENHEFNNIFQNIDLSDGKSLSVSKVLKVIKPAPVSTCTIEPKAINRPLVSGKSPYLSNKKWDRVYDGEIPNEIQELCNITPRRKVLNALIRVLIATPQLINSYDLSQQILANTINAKFGLAVNQQRVQKELSELVKFGILEVVDPTYIVGIKAKTYRACGEFLGFLESVYQKIKNIPQKLSNILDVGNTFIQNALAFKYYMFKKDYDGYVAYTNELLSQSCLSKYKVRAKIYLSGQKKMRQILQT